MGENGGKFEDWREIISSPKGLVSEEFVKVEEGGDEKRGGSIAERRAAKCGFNASRINVARFRSGTSPLSSPGKVCPYLTIPAGISPTALLDSPIMLHNSQGQPSPTTGTYPFPSLNHESLMLNSVTAAADGDSDSDVGSSLSFKTNRGPVLLPCISELANKPPMDFEFPAEYQIETVTNNCTTDSCAAEVKLSKDTFLNANCTSSKRSRPTNTAGYQMSHLLEEQQKEVCAPVEMLRTSEDGYNWRKYGQKQVKGSEFPRSYYKCTHPNCQVKKKVERSHDGQITEIIYKGAHNHPKPQPSRRTILGSQFSFTEISGIENGSGVKAGGALWRNTQMGCNDMKVGLDWRVDGLERTSSTSVVTEISDRLSNTQGKSMGLFESAGTQELSSTLVSRDGDDEDRATQGSISLGDDADDGESESKRRRKDNCIIETNMTSRASREPRVVVQIESEIDVLDDGYRWRKYGQKVVKGNPNPRSYYKCTSAGCPVRKHVERASHNLKSVITTYEGKHNHEVPAAKNSSQVNSVVGSLPPAVTSTQPPLTLPRTANAAKPEPQVHDLPLCFERKPVPSNDFMRPYSLGSLGTEMKFGASSVYPMKLPPLPNSLSFGFGSSIMNPNHNNPHTACSVSPVLHDFPFSLPMSIRGSGNMDLGGMDFSNIRNPMGSVQSFIDGQQFRENDVKFIKPKQEQDDNLYDSLPIADHANASSSSMFCHLIGNYPS